MMNPCNSFKSFEDMDVWKSCRDLRNRINSLSSGLPRVEKYKLVDQVIRSSRSVTANLAEGFGRYHYQENIQFARIARGSLYETLDHVICMCDMNYITESEKNDIRKEIIRCIQIVNGYIRYLRKAKTNNA